MKQSGNCRWKRSTAALLTAVLVCLFALPCFASEQPRVLRVAFPETDGYCMTSIDGTRSGLVVDYPNEIAKYTGWKYEYVAVPNDVLLDRFLAGEFDLMGGQFYMDGLESYYAYPSYNCGYSKLILLARQNDETIKNYDLNSFNGKTIGVYERAKENIRRLQIYLDFNNLDCTLKYYTYDQLMQTGNLNQYLELGEVDLLLGSSASAGDQFCIAASFDSQPHYIVTQPDSTDILLDLNMALENIYEANPTFAAQIYEKNFLEASNANVILSERELAYVQRTKTVTVAVPRDWHPMVCLNNDDGHSGVVPDVLQQIDEFSGLEFSYLYCDSYAASLAALKQGDADLLGFYLGTEEAAVEQGLALTTPYIELNSILVRNKESSYPADGLIGSALESRELPDSIVVDEVRYYADAATALSDVNRGKVDFFYGISARIESAIQKNHYTNLVQVNLVNERQGISFAVNSPVQPELFSILNKRIHNFTSEDKSVISSRNLVSLGESALTLSGIVYSNPTLALAVVALFLTLLLVAVLLISRSRIHAAAMRGELDRAEAESRAKSEFLSHMSHEIRTPMNAIVGLADLAGMSQDLPEKTLGDLAKIKSSSKYLLGLINDILDMSHIESGKLELAADPFSLGGMLADINSMLMQEATNNGLTFSIEQTVTNDVLIGDAIRLRQVLINLLSNAFKFTPTGGKVLVQIQENSATEKSATLTFRVIDNGVGISSTDQQRIFRSFEQLGSNYTKSQGTGLGLAISQSLVALMGGTLQLKSQLGQGSEFYFTITLPKGILPNAPALLEDVELSDADMLQDASILLAEDNDFNAEIAIELLQSRGASVERATNGKEALALFERSRAGQYGCILMDIMMPEMNGLEATTAIRSLARPDAKTIPILAMTANAFQEDKHSALAAGMTGFIPKPIDVDLLFQELHQALYLNNSQENERSAN